MKIIRLIVNWGILILSPVLILPFFIIMLVFNYAELKKAYYLDGEKWLWE